MLKLPKGLKKKKKKSKKDQDLFTEEELDEYKRQLRAKQEAAAAKSDAGESDVASDAEGLAPTVAAPSTTSHIVSAENKCNVSESQSKDLPTASAEDEEWAKFKALTSGVDTILHKTQDELDRIKKESFYQRLPSALEKERLEREEAARREAERLEEEKRKVAELEAQRDKLAEAVVEISESEEEDIVEVDDIFVTDYIDAITRGEVQLAVVPDSPDFEGDTGPDPFDTAYAEKVIIGADKVKGNKKLVPLGAAVEVLSGRVEREKVLELAKPKRKLRKGIKNLLLSESIDIADIEEDLKAPEPQKNLFDELVDDVPEPSTPIDLSISLHVNFIQTKKPEENGEDKEIVEAPALDLSEFDVLKIQDDDEFAELAAESLNKKDEVKVITKIPLPNVEVLAETVNTDWAEFEQKPKEEEHNNSENSDKPKRPPPPARPASVSHLVSGAIYISDDEEDNQNEDPFNTSYADQIIKKTTVLEEDDDFDPRAEEKSGPPVKPPPPSINKLSQPTRDLLGGSNTDLSKVGPSPIAPIRELNIDSEDFDPFDTSAIVDIVQLKETELKCIARELLTENTLKHSLSDPDFDPRENEEKFESVIPAIQAVQGNSEKGFNVASRKSSLSLNLQSKSVGFLVPDQDLLGASDGGSNKKPLTPYYAPSIPSSSEKDFKDPFDTSYVSEVKPTDIELKHLEKDLLSAALKHSISDLDFNPRAPATPVPPEDLLAVKEEISVKVLTPSQERKEIPEDRVEVVDPFDTSIAANIQPGKTELKLLESELLPQRNADISTGVLDTETDAQELGLGGKVLTPQLPHKNIEVIDEVDPFDTSIAENLAPGQIEIKLLESELIEN